MDVYLAPSAAMQVLTRIHLALHQQVYPAIIPTSDKDIVEGWVGHRVKQSAVK